MNFLGWKGAGKTGSVQEHIEKRMVFYAEQQGPPTRMLSREPTAAGQQFAMVCGLTFQNNDMLLFRVTDEDTLETLTAAYNCRNNTTGLKWYSVKSAQILEMPEWLFKVKQAREAKRVDEARQWIVDNAI